MEPKDTLETQNVADNEDFSEFLDPEEGNLNDAEELPADVKDEVTEEQLETEEVTEAEEVEGEEAEASEDFESDDVQVTLASGEVVPLGELKSGFMKSQDYTHKTEELARSREQVEGLQSQYTERLQFAETALQNVATFVESLIPPEPAVSLATTDPNAYTQQMALRNAAMRELQQLTSVKNQVDQHKNQASEQDITNLKQSSDAKLVKSMPHLKDPAARAAFDKVVRDTAEAFGFSEQEISTTYDPRVLELVHYAAIGKKSEQNRKNAQRRVQTPAKAKTPARKAAKSNSNANAMKRLSQSGSIEDAMAIDFD